MNRLIVVILFRLIRDEMKRAVLTLNANESMELFRGRSGFSFTVEIDPVANIGRKCFEPC